MTHTVKSFWNVYSAQIHRTAVSYIVIHRRPNSINCMRATQVFLEPKLIVWGSEKRLKSSQYTVLNCLPIHGASWWVLLVSVITTLYYVAKSIFHRRVWYRALSLRYARIRNSGIILTLIYLCVKFRFFRGLRCWASPWRKIVYSLNHSLTQLIWYSKNRSLRFGINHI